MTRSDRGKKETFVMDVLADSTAHLALIVFFYSGCLRATRKEGFLDCCQITPTNNGPLHWMQIKLLQQIFSSHKFTHCTCQNYCYSAKIIIGIKRST